jgi:hypothetical protein
LVVVYLSYSLFSKLFRSKIWGALSAVFFALDASGHQATSWVGTDINTHGSVIFGLLAMIILYKSNFKKIWPSIILVVISLLFKETALALFVLLPLMVYLFDKKKFLNNWRDYLRFPLVGIVYLFFRFLMVLVPKSNSQDSLVTATQSVSDLLTNTITFPVKIFSQSIFPTKYLLLLARQMGRIMPDRITGLYGTTAFDIFTETVSLQIINWLVFFLAVLFLLFMIRIAKETFLKKLAIFGFFFVILNSYIYVLSPQRTGYIPVVDSRNIYLPAWGTALYLVSLMAILAKKRLKTIVMFIFPILLINYFGLEKELYLSAKTGAVRKTILNQIKNSYPDLPERVVFYLVSDSPFYGLPETQKILPFETNLGYALLVWYQSTEDFPKELFIRRVNFLHQLTDEGYQEVGNRGFGYFRNWDSLIEAIEGNNLASDSVIAFSYSSETESIKDISFQSMIITEVR